MPGATSLRFSKFVERCATNYREISGISGRSGRI
jgi:hypothetical protein